MADFREKYSVVGELPAKSYSGGRRRPPKIRRVFVDRSNCVRPRERRRHHSRGRGQFGSSTLERVSATAGWSPLKHRRSDRNACGPALRRADFLRGVALPSPTYPYRKLDSPPSSCSEL